MSASTTGIKLEERVRARLQKLARLKKRSTHWLMKDAIEQYLDKEERFERERLEDDARYQKFLDTGTHISGDEMEAWLEELAGRAAAKAESG